MDRAPAVPLITHDPYFSVWSNCDRLYEGDTVHWTGRRKALRGYVSVDGQVFRFMGSDADVAYIEQVGLEIGAMSSIYKFANEKIALDVRFTSPLLLDDLDLMARPCTYIDFTIHSTDGAAHDVDVKLELWGEHCYNAGEPAMTGGAFYDSGAFAWMGRAHQNLLSHSGDHTTIDWGYAWLYSGDKDASVKYEDGKLCSVVRMTGVGAKKREATVIAAYDDVASIMYFGRPVVGWWARKGMTITQAIKRAAAEHADILLRCDDFDARLKRDAQAAGGAAYAAVTRLAYRQSIAAHKLIADENGQIVFLSKENDSNGCIGTVDVSYPSTPLYLLYCPELVLGMLRGVFRFARLPIWSHQYAPHDIGRYPYAGAQVYGLSEVGGSVFYPVPDAVVPPLALYPDVAMYDHRYQMPLEECGNMLVMAAAASMYCQDISLISENLDLLGKWAEYLVKYGMEPDEQLCTDDFAGHLAGNVNLSAKAVMGVEAYSQILLRLDRPEQSTAYHNKAAAMAAEWMRATGAGKADHTPLVYGQPDTWSMKYNTVWDLVFGSGLFEKEFFESECDFYLTKQNKYGLPLDSRKDYTKSDWMMWCAAMTMSKEKREKLTAPLAAFLSETPDRYPFSDWYDTATGKHMAFKNRSVQGGVFMPLLVDLAVDSQL